MKFNILGKSLVRCSFNQSIEECLESGCDVFECIETLKHYSREDLEKLVN